MQDRQHRIKAVHILYSGLGGHGSVFFSLAEANDDPAVAHIPLFFGVEALLEDYRLKCEALGLPYVYVGKKPGPDLASWRKLNQQLAALAPDIVVLHSIYAILPVWRFVRRHRCKLVVVEHDPIGKKGHLSWLWSALCLRWADRAVMLAPGYKEAMKARLGRWYRDIMEVIPNGIDTKRYAPLPEREKKEKLLLSMHSRITPQKDHASLLEALAGMKNTAAYDRLDLIIAGDGSEMEELLALSDRLDLAEKVNWVGMLNEQEVIALLQKTDIYLHPTFHETMSTSLMQAMAVGLPVITSDVPGVTHMVHQDKTGLCTPAGEAAPLQAAIELLIADPAKRANLGKNARQYAIKHFSHSKMCERYNTLFKKLQT